MTKITPFDEELISFRNEDYQEEEEETDDDGDIVIQDDGIIPGEEGEEEEQEEEEEEEEEDDDEPENQDGLNPIAILAKSFKEQGYLSDDVDINDKITDSEFAELYKKNKEELIRNEIRKELIEQEGLSSEILVTAKQLHLGVTSDNIKRVQLYNGLSKVEFNDEDENYSDVAQEFLNYYYTDINFDVALIPKQVERDINADDDELAERLLVAKRHFAKKAKDTQDDIDNTVKAEELNRANNEKEKLSKINAFIDSGTIKGVKYSKEDMAKVKKALFEKTEIFEDTDGKKYKVTLYNKKRMEIATNLESSFKQMVDIILERKDNKSAVEVEEKAKRSILSDLNKAASSIPKMSGTSKNGTGNISKYGEKVFSI